MGHVCVPARSEPGPKESQQVSSGWSHEPNDRHMTGPQTASFLPCSCSAHGLCRRQVS